jgi:flagellar biogenesis protein FliO
LLFILALEYVIRRVQANQESLKLNCTHQLFVYADDVIVLGESVNAIKENAEALILASKGIGLEVNADKTLYMVMSRDQNAGRSLNIKTDNSSFERAEESKYLGTTCTYRNSMEDEIKSRLKPEFVCYRSVQNLLSSSLLSKNIQIKI